MPAGITWPVPEANRHRRLMQAQDELVAMRDRYWADEPEREADAARAPREPLWRACGAVAPCERPIRGELMLEERDRR